MLTTFKGSGRIFAPKVQYQVGFWHSPGGRGRPALLFIVLTAGPLFTLLVLLVFSGGCSVWGRASPPLLPPLRASLPPAVSRWFGQRMMDMRREVPVICTRK